MKQKNLRITKRTNLAFLTALFALSVWVGTASASLTSTGPFTGTYSESFASFPDYYDQAGEYLPEGTSIMGGFATISSANSDMAIYNPGAGVNFGLASSYAGTAPGASQALGLNSLADTVTIVFSSAVTSFGGYFGAAYGYGYGGDITFNFSDGSSDSFTYTDPSGNDPSPLLWGGWDSSVGINSVTIGGNFAVMGGLQANVSESPVPEPTTIIAGALMLLPFGAGVARKLCRKHTA